MPHSKDTVAAAREKEQSSATKIQALFRAHLARKRLKIESIEPGIIHVRINGNETFFKRMNIDIEAGRGSRTVHWLSLSNLMFNGQLVGGDELLNPVRAPESKLDEKFGGGLTVFINGGFYNARQFYPNHPEHAPVGPVKRGSEYQGDVVPVPSDYVQHYGVLTINGADMVSAPVLSHHGEGQFDPDLLALPAYQYATISTKGGVPVPPGALFHAGDPNPRAAIAIPHETMPNGRVRLVANISERRGPESDGFKIDEWQALALYLCHLDNKALPGSAINLDGGASVNITVRGAGSPFRIAQDPKGRDSSIFLAFKERGKAEKASVSPDLLIRMFSEASPTVLTRSNSADAETTGEKISSVNEVELESTGDKTTKPF